VHCIILPCAQFAADQPVPDPGPCSAAAVENHMCLAEPLGYMGALKPQKSLMEAATNELSRTQFT